MNAKRGGPGRDVLALLERMLDEIETGAGLGAAAAAVGVHRGTVYRWGAAVWWFAEALAESRELARRRRYRPPQRRPSVPWHPGCPACGSAVEMATADFVFRFWRCERWPACPFASWRPRHPSDCGACGAPRFWSHARRSVGCPGCGRRERIGAPAR